MIKISFSQFLLYLSVKLMPRHPIRSSKFSVKCRKNAGSCCIIFSNTICPIYFVKWMPSLISNIFFLYTKFNHYVGVNLTSTTQPKTIDFPLQKSLIYKLMLFYFLKTLNYFLRGSQKNQEKTTRIPLL